MSCSKASNRAPCVIVVTGANKGIGFHIVQQLVTKCDAEARPVVIYLGSRDAGRGETAVAALADPKGRVHALQIDIEDEKSVAAAAEFVKATHGGLDVLINNAGWASKGDAFDADIARKTVAINYTGTLRVCDAFFPMLRPGARVVMTSSRAGSLSKLGKELQAKFLSDDLTIPVLSKLMESFVEDVADGTYAEKGWPRSTYAVSKMGMSMATRVLAKQFAVPGGLVNCFCPGWCRTDMAGDKAPRTAAQGAETGVFLAFLPSDSYVTGSFFADNKVISWLATL